MLELCVVTDRGLSRGRDESEVARLAYEGGADMVQLRMKDHDGREFLRQARLIKRSSMEYSGRFIVNDRADIALLSDADGVHLGQSDISVQDARAVLGSDRIVGVSVHSAEEAVQAERDGADYVSVGTIFTTATKPDARQNMGLGIISVIKEAVDIPVMAIGGIGRGNIQDVIRAGADAAAVVSAAVAADDVAGSVRELVSLIRKARPNI